MSICITERTFLQLQSKTLITIRVPQLQNHRFTVLELFIFQNTSGKKMILELNATFKRLGKQQRALSSRFIHKCKTCIN